RRRAPPARRGAGPGPRCWPAARPGTAPPARCTSPPRSAGGPPPGPEPTTVDLGYVGRRGADDDGRDRAGDRVPGVRQPPVAPVVQRPRPSPPPRRPGLRLV